MTEAEDDESLATLVADAATSIETDVSTVPGFDEWVEQHGLGRTETAAEIVARQTAFHVVLTATLYDTYRNTGTDLPALTSETFHDAIATAKTRTDGTAFAPYFLTETATLFTVDELTPLCNARTRLLDAANPAAVIGRVHETVVPQADRHRLGQFRTPPVIAELMAEWAISTADDTVLDPGIGAAALATHAYQIKQARAGTAQLREICGVDVNQLSVLMARTALRVANRGGDPDLRTQDFLTLDAAEIDTVDAVVANPPYTRHHELSSDRKTTLNTQLSHEAGRSLSALSPLYVYFYVHATQFLAPDGRLTFLTPSEFLETTYGETLKAFLLDNYHLRAIVLYDRETESQFDEAMTTSCLTFLEHNPENDTTDALTKFIRVDEWPGHDTVLETIADGTKGETGWGFVNTIRQADLDPTDKWDDLFNPITIEQTDRLVPLHRIGDVDRGIATGNNDFFCLTEDDREGEAAGFEWKIYRWHLSKLIRNSQSVPYYDYRDEDWERQRDAGREVWLLYHLDDLNWSPAAYEYGKESSDHTQLTDYSQQSDEVEAATDTATETAEDDEQPGVVEYLKYGMSDEIAAHDSHLARHRSPWYDVDTRAPADILYTYMSRDRGRFVLNRTTARNLNNLHAIYLPANVTDAQRNALLAYLNSDFADTVVKRNGRTYSTGMNKVEPDELEAVPVIDPRSLDETVVDRLAALFDDLCEAARNGDEEAVREEIDQVLSDELDI